MSCYSSYKSESHLLIPSSPISSQFLPYQINYQTQSFLLYNLASVRHLCLSLWSSFSSPSIITTASEQVCLASGLTLALSLLHVVTRVIFQKHRSETQLLYLCLDLTTVCSSLFGVCSWPPESNLKSLVWHSGPLLAWPLYLSSFLSFCFLPFPTLSSHMEMTWHSWDRALACITHSFIHTVTSGILFLSLSSSHFSIPSSC